MHSDHEPVRRRYDRLATVYDRRWRPYIDATLQAVLDVLPLDGPETLLDVPCGTGELERRLLSEFPDLRVTGADLSAEMLKQARDKEPDRPATWIQADVARLPLADEVFDVIVCANSFHYFRAAETALGELRRVLRPGGTFLLVDWCDDYLTCKLCSLWLRWSDPAFHRAYSLQSCRSLLADAGFHVDRADRFRINWLWGLMRIVCGKGQESQ
jgi:ubiquinone/menaquinone biosynthesis C-methylase UbiE